MNWKQIDNYHMKSECLRFTVCGFKTAEGWLFEAWDGRRMVATRLPSKEAAQAACVREVEEGKE